MRGTALIKTSKPSYALEGTHVTNHLRALHTQLLPERVIRRTTEVLSVHRIRGITVTLFNGIPRATISILRMPSQIVVIASTSA